MKYLKDYVLHLLPTGKWFFTKKEALHQLSINPSQFRYQAYRLIKKKWLKRLRDDFFMIIPPQYSPRGSLPPNWIIDPLMKHFKQEYYIGLLSAASFYGATEQQPMRFQVITNKPMKDIELERGSIDFHVYKDCKLAEIKQISTPTGFVNIAIKEQTMVDLVRFYVAGGHFSNIAMVIRSLAEDSSLDKFSSVIKKEKNNPVLQRLGYLLDSILFPHFSAVIEKELAQRTTRYVLLVPDSSQKKGDKNRRWKIIINDYLELE